MQAVCTTLCRCLHSAMQDICTGLCRMPAQASTIEFVQLVHLYAADIAIDVNHDGNGHGRFGCEMAMENREKK